MMMMMTMIEFFFVISSPHKLLLDCRWLVELLVYLEHANLFMHEGRDVSREPVKP